jgi:hypothetical protein
MYLDGRWTDGPFGTACHGSAATPTTAGQQQQQSALGMTQATGTPISILEEAALSSKSALNLPQMCISSDGSLRPLASQVVPYADS